MTSFQLSQQALIDLENKAATVVPFSRTLIKHGIELERAETTTLQINVGFLCNQTCGHCHLNAGPGRKKENMNAKTADDVVCFVKKCGFDVIDITGGAPELNPILPSLITKIYPFVPKIMCRSNLSVLIDNKKENLNDLFKEHKVTIIASFPSLNESQAESQRGQGIFKASIKALRKLNDMGYGQDGSGLELNLVSNPTGAFLPFSQVQTEKWFRRTLNKKWGIVFNRLLSFPNVPLGRFHKWLLVSGNLESYMKKLESGFNPCAIKGLMCRTQVSVSWDGYLYDCDFNLAKGLFMGGQKIHVSEVSGPPEPGSVISVDDHCYTCVSGSGFT